MPQLEGCVYPMHPSSPWHSRVPPRPGSGGRVPGAALGSAIHAQASSHDLLHFLRLAVLDGSGTWWRKRCALGGRRGQGPASAWEQPPCGVPHGRDTQGGICWWPGTALPAPSRSVGALGEQGLGNSVLSDFCSVSSTRLYPNVKNEVYFFGKFEDIDLIKN